jgi:hypothetical protein
MILGTCLWLINCENPSSPGVQKLFSVEAGVDDTVRINEGIFLNGQVFNNAQPRESLTITWSQISGPQATIYFPETRSADSSVSVFSNTQITEIGHYAFTLRALAGNLTVSDTVAYTVLDTLPFIVLKPLAGERIRIGDVYRIAWQCDPPFQTYLQISLDAGRTFRFLGESWQGGVNDNTWYDWQTGSIVQASDSCIISVGEYNNRSRRTYSGMFSLYQ